MRVFDASSMIYAWDNYPIEQFPGLWEWLASEIANSRLSMPAIAFDEVRNKTPDCAQWLSDNQLTLIPMSNAILQQALRIKSLLGISNDQYSTGVGENDLFIIATALEQGCELVTDENWQNNLPQDLKKYKIPAVCSMQEVNVPWMKFVDYFKRSGAVFR